MDFLELAFFGPLNRRKLMSAGLAGGFSLFQSTVFCTSYGCGMIVADIFTGSLTEIFILAAECQQEGRGEARKSAVNNYACR